MEQEEGVIYIYLYKYKKAEKPTALYPHHIQREYGRHRLPASSLLYTATSANNQAKLKMNSLATSQVNIYIYIKRETRLGSIGYQHPSSFPVSLTLLTANGPLRGPYLRVLYITCHPFKTLLIESRVCTPTDALGMLRAAGRPRLRWSESVSICKHFLSPSLLFHRTAGQF